MKKIYSKIIFFLVFLIVRELSGCSSLAFSRSFSLFLVLCPSLPPSIPANPASLPPAPFSFTKTLVLTTLNNTKLPLPHYGIPVVRVDHQQEEKEEQGDDEDEDKQEEEEEE